MSALIWVYVDCVCDLMHPGHLSFFRKARALGDRLIVGLNSDEDVMTYKPEPIMPFADRLEMVANCRLVDKALPYPAPLHCTIEHLDAIGADFVVHGDEMSPAELSRWYGAVMPSGRFRSVGYTEGISSRDIVGRVIERYNAGKLRIKP